jgi:predicted  nucleic acid-binding Zn-ribbon protein
MEGLIVAIMKDMPGYATLILGVLALGFALLIRIRKLDLDEITSIGTLQSNQLQSLQQLVATLTEELTRARDQLTEIHEQNMQLKTKVQALEELVKKYQTTPTLAANSTVTLFDKGYS